jgi:hypothetical protein
VRRGQDHVDAVGPDLGAFLDRDHVHAGAPAQELDHVALPGRVEVLDHDERHAAVGRHGAEQLLERLETARRRADPDDREGAARRRPGLVRRPRASIACRHFLPPDARLGRRQET